MRTCLLLKATIFFSLGQFSFAQEQTVKRVNSIEITGNKTFDSPTLRAQLRQVRAGAQVTSGTIEWDIEVNLKSFLKEHGFVRCSVRSEEVPLTAQDVDIHITVSEDSQYRLSSLSFKGNSLLTNQETARVFDIRPGDVVNMKKIKQGLDALQQVYRRYGFIKYSYIPEQDFDEQNKTMSLSLTIDQGHQFYISYVAFVGCRDQAEEDWLKTQTEEASIRPNLLFSPDLLESGISRLRQILGVDVKAYTEIIDRESRVGIVFWINPFAKN